LAPEVEGLASLNRFNVGNKDFPRFVKVGPRVRPIPTECHSEKKVENKKKVGQDFVMTMQPISPCLAPASNDAHFFAKLLFFGQDGPNTGKGTPPPRSGLPDVLFSNQKSQFWVNF
jgi:hypothetical protein